MSRFARPLGSGLHNNASGLSSDGPSSSTLRARLSSQRPSTAAPAASLPSPNLRLQLSDLYQHFRTCFAAVDSSAPANSQLGIRSSGAASSNHEDALAILGETFAQAGLKLHTSVVEQLSQAQSDIASRISDFSQFSSSILSDLDDLYSNLSWPLSATICHSTNFPRATIATHLVNVQDQLRRVEGELRSLHNEWEDNVRLEHGFRKELTSASNETAQQNHKFAQPAGDAATEAFKEEVERIVQDKNQALDDIEMQYKEWLQAETMEMMQFILAD